MPRFNSIRLWDDVPSDDEPPPNATNMSEDTNCDSGSILLGYTAAFVAARWMRPPPEARLSRHVFDRHSCGAVTFWAIVRFRRRPTWLREQRTRRVQCSAAMQGQPGRRDAYPTYRPAPTSCLSFFLSAMISSCTLAGTLR